MLILSTYMMACHQLMAKLVWELAVGRKSRFFLIWGKRPDNKEM